mgnify:CR=1 FL=1
MVDQDRIIKIDIKQNQEDKMIKDLKIQPERFIELLKECKKENEEEFE